MSATATPLAALQRQRPEWRGWLNVIADVMREAQAPIWATLVPGQSSRADGNVPLLDGAVVPLDAELVAGLLERLRGIAARGITAEMATLAGVPLSGVDALYLFGAALRMDTVSITSAAAACGADEGAFHAVVSLLPVPFLQACHRQWAVLAEARGVASHCPVCGAWPALTEVRGIERSRYHRCGRCGAAWHAHGLSCPFCATADHHDLVSLVPEHPGAPAFVEACTRCLGYVKVLNRLQGCAPLDVLVEDIGTVALDIVALEHGYRRPAGPGYPLSISVPGSSMHSRVTAGA